MNRHTGTDKRQQKQNRLGKGNKEQKDIWKKDKPYAQIDSVKQI